MDGNCDWTVLKALLTFCRHIGHDEFVRSKLRARIIIDLTLPQAAIPLNLLERRATGIYVGSCEASEAIDYVSPRLPIHLDDDDDRDALATAVVDSVDANVLYLRQVCEAFLSAGNSSVSRLRDEVIAGIQTDMRIQADAGWTIFCERLTDRIGGVEEATSTKAIKLLLREKKQYMWDFIQVFLAAAE